MMAMRELKLPMLKHSRATSMKNSMTRALCFFFTGCRRYQRHQCNAPGASGVPRSPPRLTMQISVATR